MILQALKELAESADLVGDYEWREVSYCVVIGRDGRVLNFEPTPGELASVRGRLRGKSTRVPRHNGDTASKPQFFWGKAEFIFGIGTDKTRAALRHQLFLQEVEACATATGDEGATRLLIALRAYDKDRDPPLPQGVEPETVLVFRYEPDIDVLVSSRAAVEHHWEGKRRPTSDDEVKGFTCLITGEPCTPIGKSPVLRHVPAGGNNTPLVSFDQGNPAFESYGLVGCENAPISWKAAEAYVAGLNRLLDRDFRDAQGNRQPCRRVDLNRDTAVVFWSRETSLFVDLFAEVMEASPEAVRALFEAPYTGSKPILEDPQAFYAAVISGAKGRAVLRRWMETTVADVARSVRLYFDDIAIIQPWGDNRPQPLRALLRSTAAFGETDNIPPRLAADMFAAILRDTTPYPRSLLDTSMRRMRAEQSRRDAKGPWRSGPVPPERAALIKAYLSRANRLHRLAPNFPEVTMSLDAQCPNVPYRLGRLFAVLERLQEVAVHPSATIRDRFFGAASSNPVTVFPRLIRGAQPHVSKADAGHYFDRLIAEILDGLKQFPATLNLEDQGLFAIGYYHQRQALFTKKPVPPTPTN